MAEYLELKKVLDDKNIITVQTKEYGSIEVIPVDTITDIELSDVQPIKHGRWEYIRNVKLSGTIKLCECNQCHNKIFGGLSYCGNCGARMEQEG